VDTNYFSEIKLSEYHKTKRKIRLGGNLNQIIFNFSGNKNLFLRGIDPCRILNNIVVVRKAYFAVCSCLACVWVLLLPVGDENPMNFLWIICKTVILKATFSIHDVTKITITKLAWVQKRTI